MTFFKIYIFLWSATFHVVFVEPTFHIRFHASQSDLGSALTITAQTFRHIRNNKTEPGSEFITSANKRQLFCAEAQRVAESCEIASIGG